MNKLNEFLRDNPFFWSRLGFCYDPPRCDSEGKPIVFSRDIGEYNRIHQDFAKAGVKLHTTILHSGWVADGVYDYSLTDEVLHWVFKGNPDILYMPRVKLNVPADWCRNNPEDTFVYYYGPRDAETIASLAETEKHDYFGFDSPGYAVNGGKGVWKDDRVNFDGLIGLQSFSSKKWINDASETLRRLLIHLSQSEYSDRIIGVHVAFGMCGETNLWGSWSPVDNEEKGLLGRRGDFGITNRKMFAEYELKKYGSEEKALEALGDLEPPTPYEREGIKENLKDFFCIDNPKVSDYFEFVSETTAEAIEEFCKVVKESSDLFGKELAAGAFYGYMYIHQSPNAGHLGFNRLLNSPYLDFMSSPKGYFRCLAGDPGGEQGPSESVALKKVWLDEIDNHTHLDRRPNGRAENSEESKTLLWREAIKNITHGQGFWWMDLGEGWFDCPELMDEIKEITDLQSVLGKIKRKSSAEILIVVDERSMLNMTISSGLSIGLLYQLHSEIKLVGAPVDTLRMTDLYEVDLSQYKMIVFTNCFYLEKGEREKLLGLIKDKFVVWNYASGILAPEFDKDNYRRLTGFNLREIPREDINYYGYSEEIYKFISNHKRKAGDFPLFTVESEGMEVINRHPTGEVNCAIKDNVCVCAVPNLLTDDFRKLAKKAGVNIMCDADCTVFADNAVAGFFPKDDFKGEIKVGDRIINAEIPGKGRYIVKLK